MEKETSNKAQRRQESLARSNVVTNKMTAVFCALVALASLGSYWETALPLSFCALMMFAALILTLRHTQREENVI